MEDLVNDRLFGSQYLGRSVLVTGHTGFKGGWLATWLKLLGARVAGFSLPPEGEPSLFKLARVDEKMQSVFGDVRDPAALGAAFAAHRPEFVFHLAAQPLVRRSYDCAVETFATNVMGTVHVLEAIRHCPSVKAAVIVTSDKCYENREWLYGYRECDAMGGDDPYSASKGAAELVIASYRRSFFSPTQSSRRTVGIASVRAGNVIGGGDWAPDRLIPDCVRALASGQVVRIRNPRAVRPWQHVLEPLGGYLWLGACLREEPERFEGGWNFGPGTEGDVAVQIIVEETIREWGTGSWEESGPVHDETRPEAGLLKLDCSKAASLLGCKTIWATQDSVRQTVAWYRQCYSDPHFDAPSLVRRQIGEYVETARDADLPWARKVDPTTPAHRRPHRDAGSST